MNSPTKNDKEIFNTYYDLINNLVDQSLEIPELDKKKSKIKTNEKEQLSNNTNGIIKELDDVNFTIKDTEYEFEKLNTGKTVRIVITVIGAVLVTAIFQSVIATIILTGIVLWIVWAN